MSISRENGTGSVLERGPSGSRLSEFSINLIASTAVLLPIGGVLILIWHYGVNVPFWDEWSLIDLFEHAHSGKLTIADFVAQNNEHRLVFPKLIFLALEQIFGWNPRLEMFASVFLCVLEVFVLRWILGRTLQPGRLGRVVLPFAISLLLFSPCQHENWLWGYQLGCFLLNLCMVVGVAVLCLQVSLTAKFFISAAAALIATFSGANGIALWPALLLAFLLGSNKTEKRNVVRWTVAWTATGLCAIALYYLHYRKPSWHPPLAASRNAFDYLCYLTAFVGCPLSGHTDTGSLVGPIWIGSIEVALFLLFVGLLVRNRTTVAFLSRAAPWLAIASYSLLTAFMACVARVGFGRTQALASRYTTFSLLFAISLIPLGLLSEISLEPRKAVFLRWLNRILFLVAILLLATAFPYGLRKMRLAGEMRRKGRIALTFINCLPQKEVLETTINPNLLVLTNHARRANVLHLLHPPLLQPSELYRRINLYNANVDTCGALEGIDKIGENSYVARGWATLPHSARPADAVILAYRNAKKDANAFAIALEQFANAPQVYPNYRMNRGWKGCFTRKLIPSRASVEIEAWAFDNSTGKVCKLAGSCSLE